MAVSFSVTCYVLPSLGVLLSVCACLWSGLHLLSLKQEILGQIFVNTAWLGVAVLRA